LISHLGVQSGRIAKSKAKASLSAQAGDEQDEEVSDDESLVEVPMVKKEAVDNTFQEMCKKFDGGARSSFADHYEESSGEI
jgi:hypothetical protein